MSVGIHSGLFHFFLVGESHRELLVAGPGATATVTMEATADAGEIVISDATASALRPGVVGASKGPGHLLRRAPAVPADSFLPFEYVDPDLDLLHGIPTGFRDVLSGSHQESEHRRVTVAFIHFDGTDGLIERVGPTETADQLDALVSHVHRTVERQEITFLATDADQDGGKIILTAGAPSTSGDDEHHMLLAVREIMDAHGPLPIRIGVNRGAVFVGEVGPPYRRTFTVMGDAVNLAARLMAKATPGQILITPEILSRSRTGFATEELEPFRVKGKSEPVRALAVGAMTGPRRVGGGRDLPLVGRVTETRTLEQAIGQAKAGTGSLVEIIGEPGAGKSRLVAWLRTAADDMVQLSTVCERYDASTPYHVVGRLLRTLIGLPPEGNSPQVAAAFLTHLEQRTPTVLSRAPLIATALGLSVPETPETRDIDEGFRRARMAEAVIDLLGELLPDSGLLTVEDAHFMDEASADLFGYLAALVGPSSWLICVTRRDGGSALVRACGAHDLHRARTARGRRGHRARPPGDGRCTHPPAPHRCAGRALGRQPAVPARTAGGGHGGGGARGAAGLGRAGGRRTHRPALGRRSPPAPAHLGARPVVPLRGAHRGGRRRARRVRPGVGAARRVRRPRRTR